MLLQPKAPNHVHNIIIIMIFITFCTTTDSSQCGVRHRNLTTDKKTGVTSSSPSSQINTGSDKQD